jgi:predicted dehydrogenase
MYENEFLHSLNLMKNPIGQHETTIKFAVVGTGWRAEFFTRLAAQIPGVECVGSIVRTPRESNVPIYLSLEDCIRKAKPDFLVCSVPREVTPEIIRLAVKANLPILAETPPAGDLDSLRALWTDVGQSGLVQIAEQYLQLPSHAGRLAVVKSGAIGKPTQVQVSSTHDYHAISIMRGYLGAGIGPVKVNSTGFLAPLQNPASRDSWNSDVNAIPTKSQIATIEFDATLSGLYDFTDNQWHNQLRFRRIVVRGSHGEINGDEAISWSPPDNFVNAPIVRRQSGYDLDLDGYRTDHISFNSDVVYKNPFIKQSWSDEEIAIATMITKMASWVAETGPAPYPLAEGIHDQRVALAIQESLEKSCAVTTGKEAWDS